MSTMFSAIGEPGNTRPQSAVPLDYQLRELVTSVLIDDIWVEVHPEDPVGGGAACVADGCPRPQITNGMCSSHFDRWNKAGRPELSAWNSLPNPGPQLVKLERLPLPLRHEVAYGIDQARRSPNPPTLRLGSLWSAVAGLDNAGISSLLEPDEQRWPFMRDVHRGKSRAVAGTLKLGFLTFTIDELDRLRGQYGHELEYARDSWRMRRLGVTGTAQGLRMDFRGIEQLWLRTAVKRFLRWRRETEHSGSGMHRDVVVLTQLSEAFTACAGAHAGPEQFDRAVIERFLTGQVEQGYPPNQRRQRMASVRRFLEIARQHDWIPTVPASAALYAEDLPREVKLAPRSLSPTVMAQLESPENLAKLTDPRWRLLFPLLIETGLRINDALYLAQDCVIHDAQNAPYLRYMNRKMKREALVPISPEIAAAIAQQAARVRDQYSAAALLFPRSAKNADGLRPFSTSHYQAVLKDWIDECRVVDDQGMPVRITAHQFRHTLGTRLINKDVPLEVVRKILDHSSWEMTAHYARLHDDTVRRHWERARKVDINGNAVTVDEDSPLADAQWTKQHLARATMALPNGYCGLPLQQSCPHANACLTCPVFITTPEFLPQHREQLELTRGIIERAQHRGQLRVAEMNQRTADNLLTIITTLETPNPETGSETMR
ncbi:tyrosine-type recombinase/integrase [Mycolicibacterium llatzerense]|uniref:tyrosine-type recombinase/integrase n=1 Tax=Mycolicibacterium llatzerense TaxID=280871 RepID=UPI0009F20171|nr:tyrosine-type recombinase/integrase [Mycolicibacterium llatzerense]